MPNEIKLFQPLTNGTKQVGEQMTTTLKTGLDAVAQTASSLLSGVARLPGFPMPGAAAAPRNSRKALPTIEQFVSSPAAAFSQLEDVALPAGAPRVSQLLPGARRRAVPTEEAPTTEETPTPVPTVRGGIPSRRGY